MYPIAVSELLPYFKLYRPPPAISPLTSLAKNVNFIDAPISGGQSGAESGKLSIMIGGERQSYEKVKNVLNTYSKFYKYMGPSGSGQLTKMVNQICIAGLIQALSEGMNFAVHFSEVQKFLSE